MILPKYKFAILRAARPQRAKICPGYYISDLKTTKLPMNKSHEQTRAKRGFLRVYIINQQAWILITSIQ